MSSCRMRTTIEISPEQHDALAALARARGVRGFSTLVQEALTAYLQEVGTGEVDLPLSLEGSLSEDEATEVRSRIAEAAAGTG